MRDDTPERPPGLPVDHRADRAPDADELPEQTPRPFPTESRARESASTGEVAEAEVIDETPGTTDALVRNIVAISRQITQIMPMEQRHPEYWLLAMLEELRNLRDLSDETIRRLILEHIEKGTINPTKAARATGYSVGSIYNWMNAGGVAPKKRGIIKGRPRQTAPHNS